jgi:hypothetical protein
LGANYTGRGLEKKTVKRLFMHPKPTIQRIVLARITAVMVFLKDELLVTNETHSIKENWHDIIDFRAISPRFRAESR